MHIDVTIGSRIRLSNFVLGRSFTPYGVFRKHRRPAWIMRAGRLLIHHLKRFQGIAGLGSSERAKCTVPSCCLGPQWQPRLAATLSMPLASEPRGTDSRPGPSWSGTTKTGFSTAFAAVLVPRDGSRVRLAPPRESVVWSVPRRAEKSKRSAPPAHEQMQRAFGSYA